jgi:8-amino-7-oxononanoate synthase
MALLDELHADLADLESRGILRSRADQLVRSLRQDWIDVSSNDYLGLGRRTVSRETLDALAGLSSGSGASRLIHGSRPTHSMLEAELARWVDQEAALTFSSGYAANVGALTALLGPGDLVISDALNHASIIDGCRLCTARVRVVPHRDLEAVAKALEEPARRRWVVTETYFSMDGDSPDLARLRTLCDSRDAGLVLDEAHAMGVFGRAGGGLSMAQGVRADVVVGTLGKAVGYQGAFVAGPAPVLDLVWNRARSFVFSTATSPLVAAQTLHQVRTAMGADRDRERLAGHVGSFARALSQHGVRVPIDRHGPIFPIIVGKNDEARSAAFKLWELGILTQAIRPPTVPLGTARLRIALHADLLDSDIERLAAALGTLCVAT